MTVVAVLLSVLIVFLLGAAMGSQWQRRDVTRRERRIADARRRLHTFRDDHGPRGPW